MNSFLCVNIRWSKNCRQYGRWLRVSSYTYWTCSGKSIGPCEPPSKFMPVWMSLGLIAEVPADPSVTVQVTLLRRWTTTRSRTCPCCWILLTRGTCWWDWGGLWVSRLRSSHISKVSRTSFNTCAPPPTHSCLSLPRLPHSCLIQKLLLGYTELWWTSGHLDPKDVLPWLQVLSCNSDPLYMIKPFLTKYDW